MAEVKSKQTTVPLILLGVDLALIILGALRRDETSGFAAMLVAMSVDTAIRVFFLIVVAFITARLLGTGFGDFNLAILKFAAIVVFTSGLEAALNIGYVGWAIAAICWFGLLNYLFDMDGKEALIFMGVMIALNVVITLAIDTAGVASMFSAHLH